MSSDRRASAPFDLDDPQRGPELASVIQRKPALRRLYQEVYERYAATLTRCPDEGLVVELGSGAGFAKDIVPQLTTTDILPYAGVDQVLDACQMTLPDNSVRLFCMFNVLHHIADVETFFRECQRCLVPGGRVLIVDQYPGWISHWILRYAHHEPYDCDADSWSFPSTGPLSGANGALAWIVFFRDRDRFASCFPQLMIERLTPHTPLRYWLSGGLKRWSLLPESAWRLASSVDAGLLACSTQWGSFVDIELIKSPEH